jgi:hypothetical protein
LQLSEAVAEEAQAVADETEAVADEAETAQQSHNIHE